MESVRQETEEQTNGVEVKAAPTVVALSAQKNEVHAGERFLGESENDQTLLSEADHVDEIVEQAKRDKEALERPLKSSKSSLLKVSIKEESEETRAARFFATHDMMKVG